MLKTLPRAWFNSGQFLLWCISCLPLISTIKTSGPLPVSTIVPSLVVSLVSVHGACLVNTVPISSLISLWAVPITTTGISIPISSLTSPASICPTSLLQVANLSTCFTNFQPTTTGVMFLT
uniref:Uncharacterized protein n=1 Tax=Helianthus annuus TaxID=4232 RepID=A0A251VD24_HELAN